MAGSLAQAFKDLQSQLQKLGTSSCVEGVIFDDGSVVVSIQLQDTSIARVRIIFAEPQAYPNSPAIISPEDDQALDSEKVAEIMEQCQDKAHLNDVVIKVLRMYGLSLDLPVEQPRLQAKHDMDEDAMSSGNNDGPSDEYDDDDGMRVDEDYEYNSDNGDDSGDGEDHSDGSGGEEDEEERAMIIATAKRQRRWEDFESKYQEAHGKTNALLKTGDSSSMSFEQQAVAKKQIFDPKGAFLMLSRSLQSMQQQMSCDVFVDTLDDDVYRWTVEMGDFDLNSPIHKDLQLIQRRYHYSTVKVHITFKRGLHPFYPPSLELKRPHFQGHMLGAMGSLVTLDNWNPCQHVDGIIGMIKGFLEHAARVDVDHDMNDINRYSEASYSVVEQQLARLEVLSAVSPVDLEGCGHLYEARDAFFRTWSDKDRQEASTSGRESEPGSKRIRSTEEIKPSSDAAQPISSDTGGSSAGVAAGTAAGAAGKTAGALSGARATGAAKGGAGGGSGAATLGGAQGSVKGGAGGGAGAAAVGGAKGGAAAVEGAHGAVEGEGEGVVGAAAEAALFLEGLAGGGGTLAVKTGKNFWAAGTGYGSGNSNPLVVWDPRASEAAQRAADDELQQVLQVLTTAIGHDLDPANSPEIDTMDVDVQPAGSKEPPPLNRQASSCPGGPHPTKPVPSKSPEDPSLHKAVPTTTLAACVALIRDSCFLPFLIRELNGTTFTDSRTSYYTTLMLLVRALCNPAAAHLLLTDLPGQVGSSVRRIFLPELHTMANHFIRASRPFYDAEMNSSGSNPSGASSSAGGSATHAGGSSSAAADGTPASGAKPQSKTASAQATNIQELGAGLALADLIVSCSSYISDLVEKDARAGAGEAAAEAGGTSCSAMDATVGALDGSGSAEPEDYCACMKQFQVALNPSLNSSQYAFKSDVSSENCQPMSRQVRLAKELAGLQKFLPITESSSILVRIDEQQMMVWKVLITGPEDTPYDGGCFVFDMYFPSTYPSVPPKLLLKTTGGKTVRFNPNLYDCGKVCLSLLGTWRGGKGEGWNAEVSTAMQVLLSIQSLILVPAPYFNEPGFEQTIDTKEGKSASRQYNKAIHIGTIRYAMMDLLKHPPAEFADAIKNHFRLRRDYILKTTQMWVDEAHEFDKAHSEQLKAYRERLKQQLEEL